MDNNLVGDFVESISAAFSKYPDLQNKWTVSENEDSCCLGFQKQSSDGFAVVVEYTPGELHIFAHRVHLEFERGINYDEAIEATLETCLNLLSPDYRIREYLAADSAYKWKLEIFNGEKWHGTNTTSILFWNYFGRRIERIYQNHILPSRYKSE
ncbi:hypothetical protein L0337_27120 [candidate division KSB1 bacterium]|nr:hypothetical protein [candidate division KSB1 bacterium]